MQGKRDWIIWRKFFPPEAKVIDRSLATTSTRYRYRTLPPRRSVRKLFTSTRSISDISTLNPGRPKRARVHAIKPPRRKRQPSKINRSVNMSTGTDAHVSETRINAHRSRCTRNRITETKVRIAASAKVPPGDTRTEASFLAGATGCRSSGKDGITDFRCDEFKLSAYRVGQSTGMLTEKFPRFPPGSV